MYCNNCGTYGHSYFNCRYPIMSFGIMIFHKDESINKLLMIQRKHSLCYIEFLRGKYKVDNLKYIETLFSKMTDNEKDKIINMSFDDLWNDLWIDVINLKSNFRSEYNIGKKKFEILLSEKLIEDNYNKTKGNYSETEWELPKGRRNEKEKNIECAIREVEEETGLKYNKDYLIYKNVIPLINTYKSFNNVNYRHVFYIGKLINPELINTIKVNEDDIEQQKEINDIRFMEKETCIQKIRNYDVNNKEIVNKLFMFIEDFENNFDEI